MKLLLHRLYCLLIEPHREDPDGVRREFVLNTILTGLLALATLAVFAAVLDFLVLDITHESQMVVETLVFWAVVALLLTASRRGHPRIASVVFVGFLFVSAMQFTLAWSFRLAEAELVFALTIVVAGVLFTAWLSFVASALVAGALLIVAQLQISGHQVPYTGWQDKPMYLIDAIGYIAIFVAIGIVSWLSNVETARSLKRARSSEAQLLKQNESLEHMVAERTRALEEMQAARLLELQPFAEFGRIGASLVHEIANPLTAATLHLEALNKQEHSALVRQVQRNLHQLERYLVAARKQIKRESDLRLFAVGSELQQIVRLLQHRARRAHVRVIADKITHVKLYGDVVKFDQLIANLLANAIDAAESAKQASAREVQVHVFVENHEVIISITDHGEGVAAHNLEHMFEPFHSTKKTARRSGLGIGLALVKQYVEYDFRGSITVTSSPAEGTTFTVRLRGQERP